jgi:hypothetical protein
MMMLDVLAAAVGCCRRYRPNGQRAAAASFTGCNHRLAIRRARGRAVEGVGQRCAAQVHDRLDEEWREPGIANAWWSGHAIAGPGLCVRAPAAMTLRTLLSNVFPSTAAMVSV